MFLYLAIGTLVYLVLIVWVLIDLAKYNDAVFMEMGGYRLFYLPQYQVKFLYFIAARRYVGKVRIIILYDILAVTLWVLVIGYILYLPGFIE